MLLVLTVLLFSVEQIQIVKSLETIAQWNTLKFTENTENYIPQNNIIGDVRSYKGSVTNFYAVWKFENFPATHILREINFDNSIYKIYIFEKLFEIYTYVSASSI